MIPILEAVTEPWKPKVTELVSTGLLSFSSTLSPLLYGKSQQGLEERVKP